jgi:hypothetical protein
LSVENKKYNAFISYRHADNKEQGRQWATWLHQAIETYDVPADLVGKKNGRGEKIPARIFPIFRDEEELPANADLGNSIVGALNSTRLLIVLCSPKAVASTYVADEIDYFKKLGHSDRIVSAIIDGEPNASWDKGKQAAGFSAEDECFPIPLQFEYDENGNRTAKHAEPIAADFRINNEGVPEQAWTSIEAYRQHLKNTSNLNINDIKKKVESYQQQQHLMLLKIIAGILGVPLGELTQRDKEYQLELERQRAKKLRRWLSAVVVLATLAIIAGGLAYIQQQKAKKHEIEAVAQRDIAEQKTVEVSQALGEVKKEKNRSLEAQSNYLVDLVGQKLESQQYDTGMLLALNGLPGKRGGDRKELPSLRRLLDMSAAKNRIISVKQYPGNSYNNECLFNDHKCLASDSKQVTLTHHNMSKCRNTLKVDDEPILSIYRDLIKKHSNPYIYSFSCSIEGNEQSNTIIFLNYLHYDNLVAMLEKDEHIDGDNFKNIFVWDNITNKIQLQITGSGKFTDVLKIDSKRLLTLSSEYDIEMWDLNGGQKIFGFNVSHLVGEYQTAHLAKLNERYFLLTSGDLLSDKKIGKKKIEFSIRPKNYHMEYPLLFGKVAQESSTLILLPISKLSDNLIGVDINTGTLNYAVKSLDTSGFQDTSISDFWEPTTSREKDLLITFPTEQMISIINKNTGKVKINYKHEHEVINARFDKNIEKVITLSSHENGSEIKLFNLQDEKPVRTIGFQSKLIFANFGFKNNQIVTHEYSEEENSIAIDSFDIQESTKTNIYAHQVQNPEYDAKNDIYVHPFNPSKSFVTRNKLLVIYSHTSADFKIVDLKDQQVLVSSNKTHPTIRGSFISENGEYLGVYDSNGIHLYDLENGDKEKFIEGDFSALYIEDDGSLIIYSDHKGFVTNRSLKTNKITKTKIQRESLRLIGRTNNNVLVTSSVEGIEYWDLDETASRNIESKLPLGRKCLTPDERDKYYLPRLDKSQWIVRGCPQ